LNAQNNISVTTMETLKTCIFSSPDVYI